jgi:uncharacterized membrane protein YedE/YeeE
MLIIVQFCAGLLFGVGLVVSGMANPAKVLGFLDLAGAWDPSLLLVMGGAVLVGLVAFGVARRRSTSLLGEPMRLPQATRIDARLVTGALLFGAGWGVAGFCPGPALVATAAGSGKAIVFTLAMLAGMVAFEAIEKLKERRQSAPGEHSHAT